MKLYTRTGDSGETGLFGGSRVSKDHLRVIAYGEVDEANSALGWAAAAMAQQDWVVRLQEIQGHLFAVGALLASAAPGPHTPGVNQPEVEQLERWIDELEGGLAPLTSFILPGGTEAAARLHLARTVLRRAERAVVTLSRHEELTGATIPYLNRLSDLLFALARWANQAGDVKDVPWNG